jgi:hypothetical protein
MDETLIQFLFSILMLFSSVFLIFNGCSGSKAAEFVEEKKVQPKKVSTHSPTPVENRKEIYKTQQNETLSTLSLIKNDVRDIPSPSTSSEIVEISIEKSKTSAIKECLDKNVRFEMNFQDWDTDLQISGDEEEKVIEKITKKLVAKKIEIEKPVKKETPKVDIRPVNFIPDYTIQLKFSDWNSDIKID